MPRFPWTWKPIMSWPAYQRWQRRRAWKQVNQAFERITTAVEELTASFEQAARTIGESLVPTLERMKREHPEWFENSDASP